jgi:hypothetical protein
MSGFFKFAGRSGKERGLLALYILHTLDGRPGSGYELIKEIEEKTGGKWVPSKGTLYPVLKQLEEEHLIELTGIGSRAKNIYTLTPKERNSPCTRVFSPRYSAVTGRLSWRLVWRSMPLSMPCRKKKSMRLSESWKPAWPD